MLGGFIKFVIAVGIASFCSVLALAARGGVMRSGSLVDRRTR